MTSNSILISDESPVSTKQFASVILWKSYENGDGLISIPTYLEDNSVRLRDRYLSFIHDLGESVINGKMIVEHMNISDDFSLWWMSQVAEKSPFKSPRIYDCLRIFALEEIIIQLQPDNIHLINSDRAIIKTISDLCSELGVPFTFEKGDKGKNTCSLKNIYRSFPHALQGLFSLRHLFGKWVFKRLDKPKWFTTGSVFMCSYFYHLDTVAGDKDIFYSRQWEELPRIMNDNGVSANWLHHYLSTPGMPDKKKSVEWFERFNMNADKQGNHAFIETYLSFNVVFKLIRNWMKLLYTSWVLRSVRQVFTPDNSNINLWLMLEHDWKTSLSGSSAINNCLWVELFDAALKEMPVHKKGLYLWENQGWETALIHAWKKNGHGRLIGVPHSTIRFWALNNFDDVRTISSINSLSKPTPDYLAINGELAWQEFVHTDYPVTKMLKVEALRYQYLLSPSKCPDKNIQFNSSIHTESNTDIIRMLIIGDFSTRQTSEMLRCVEGAVLKLEKSVVVTLKPHPVCRIHKNDFPNLAFTITNKPLDDIMYDFDVAFCGNTTSGGLDALLFGLATIIFLDDTDFNHSPLRGVGGVKFIANSDSLVRVLGDFNSQHFDYCAGDFFWMNKELSLWHKVLNDSWQ